MVKDYVVFDLETTGLSPDKDTIIEIGALKVIQGKVADRFSEFINPHQKLTQQISELTGITDDMLAGARNLQVVVGDFVDFCEDYVVVGHNLGFDYRFTKMAAEKTSVRIKEIRSTQPPATAPSRNSCAENDRLAVICSAMMCRLFFI